MVQGRHSLNKGDLYAAGVMLHMMLARVQPRLDRAGDEHQGRGYGGTAPAHSPSSTHRHDQGTS